LLTNHPRTIRAFHISIIRAISQLFFEFIRQKNIGHFGLVFIRLC
jgi:hypothetical protein